MEEPYALFGPEEAFRVTAARIRSFKAASGTTAPSLKSTARVAFASNPALKRPRGSARPEW